MRLEGKKIVLGITGSIAAYKAAMLLRLLVKEGAEVQVVITQPVKNLLLLLRYQHYQGNLSSANFLVQAMEAGTAMLILVCGQIYAGSACHCFNTCKNGKWNC
jgi:phosphopantothenoylcysteine synthetase/decarboxylase